MEPYPTFKALALLSRRAQLTSWRVAPSNYGPVIIELTDIEEESTMASCCCDIPASQRKETQKENSTSWSEHNERIKEADTRVCVLASKPF